jgi:hypothetical protein
MAQRELNILIKAEDLASKEISNLNNKLGGLSKSFEDTAADFRKAGAVITGVGVGLGALLRTTGLTAARTETMGVAMEAVARATGTSMDMILQQEEALKKQGITTQEARNTLTKFMQSQLDVADASKVARIAQDLAVIAGENSSQTTARLTQAIASMNPELLRQVGIVKNMNDVFSDYGDKIGKNASDLTTLEKKQAMVNLIFEEGEKVAGTYEMAMGTVGKQLGSLDRHIEEAKNSFGQAFLPIMAVAIEKLTELLVWFNKLSPEIKTTATKVVMITAALALFIGPLLLVIGFLPMLSAGFSILMGPVGLVIITVAALAALFAGPLIKAIGEGNFSLKGFLDMINDKTGIIDLLRNTWENVVLMFNERLMPSIRKLWEALTPLKPFLELFAKVIGVILYGAFIVLVKLLEVYVIIAIEVLTRTINFAVDAVNFFKKGWDGLINTLASVITWIDKAISKIKELNFLQGVKDKVSGWFGGGRALGGPVTKGGTYLVGEEGPELFTPNRSGNIIPNAKLKSASIGNGGGTSINITVNGDVSGEELIEKVSQGIMRNLSFNTSMNI